MARIYRLQVMFLAASLAGCSTHILSNEIPAPPPGGPYVDQGAETGETALLIGTLTRSTWADDQRVRAVSIDNRLIPIETRYPRAIAISTGPHTLSIACEYERGTGQAIANLSLDAQSGGRYVLKCEEKSGVINLGTNIWIEDETNKSVVVAKVSTWSPAKGLYGYGGF